jgi:hypothetical protein
VDLVTDEESVVVAVASFLLQELSDTRNTRKSVVSERTLIVVIVVSEMWRVNGDGYGR